MKDTLPINAGPFLFYTEKVVELFKFKKMNNISWLLMNHAIEALIYGVEFIVESQLGTNSLLIICSNIKYHVTLFFPFPFFFSFSENLYH